MTHESALAAITERFGTDASLRRSIATSRALIDAMPDVLIRISADGIVVSYKASSDDLLLIPESDWVGSSLEAIFGHAAADLYSALGRALTDGHTQVVDLSLVLQGRMREYEARLVATEPNEAIAIFRDLTERLAAERATLATIADVGHEIRTPLTAIRGALGLLLRGVGGDLTAPARALISVANSNAGRVLRLVGDLLDSEKAASGTMSLALTPQDLQPLIDEAIASNQTYAALFNVRFVSGATLPTVAVAVDGDRLIQVLTNVLANAARFSPSGGSVEISTMQLGATVRIAVRDDGPGIPEAFRPRMFQKFAQAPATDSRFRGGTGLGLSISKAIIEQLGGAISFESTVGVGTTFFVDLPIYVGGALAVGDSML